MPQRPAAGEPAAVQYTVAMMEVAVAAVAVAVAVAKQVV